MMMKTLREATVSLVIVETAALEGFAFEGSGEVGLLLPFTLYLFASRRA